MITTANTNRYFLSKHAYTCSVDNHIVILDLRNDAYLSLPPQFSATFRHLLNDTSGQAGNGSNTIPSEEDPKKMQQLKTALLEKGLITENQNYGKTLTSPTIEKPRADFMGYYKVDAKPKISVFHIASYFKAAILTAMQLRWQSLENIILRVKKRKQKLNDIPQKTDIYYIWDFVEIFLSLSPLLSSGKDKCLHNSLTLVEFLSYYNIYPDWVFGVKMGPFGAHSWVQYGDILLNDTTSHTTSFTPILVI